LVRRQQIVGAQWQLYSVDVKTGADKFLAPIDLPASTDGKRVLISIAKWPFDIWMIDIWMMEGFDQPASRTWRRCDLECRCGEFWFSGGVSFRLLETRPASSRINHRGQEPKKR